MLLLPLLPPLLLGPCLRLLLWLVHQPLSWPRRRSLVPLLLLPWDHKRYQVRVIANRYSGVIAYSGFAITL